MEYPVFHPRRPHGFPVRTSFHSSLNHLLSAAPFLVFFKMPYYITKVHATLTIRNATNATATRITPAIIIVFIASSNSSCFSLCSLLSVSAACSFACCIRLARSSTILCQVPGPKRISTSVRISFTFSCASLASITSCATLLIPNWSLIPAPRLLSALFLYLFLTR